MPETAIPSRAWQRRFDGKPISPIPAIAELDIERNELAHTWKRFTSLLLPQDQIQWEERPQTVLDVQTLLGNIKTFWMSRPRPRVFTDSMDLCDRLLPTVDAHSILLSALPDHMAYSPLFYGVVQSVIKASSHYPRDVYSEFHHLVIYIQLQALNFPWQHAVMDVDDEEEEDPYSPRALWEESRLSQVGCQGKDRRIAAQNTITRRLIWEVQQDAEERTRYREGRDRLLAETLSSVCEQLQPVSEQSSGIVCITTPPAPNIDISSFEWSRGSKRRLARLEIQSSSKHLQDFFDSDDQICDYEPGVKVVAEASIVASLQQWATSSRSQALAVGGTQPTASLDPVALISACYASFARQARLPVVSHFCVLSSKEARGLNLHEQGLIALTYSIIRQLINWLPPLVDSDAVLDLSAERFRQLDGTLTSWKAALSLVDTLLQSAPPLLVFIIDGLDAIHNPSTDGAIRELVRVLLTHTRRQPQGGLNGQGPTLLMKVLFTVTGRPSALVETLSEHMLILSESNKTNQPTPSGSVLTSDLGAVMMNA
ncbi:7TM GPCR, rhodopsin-like [Penicillium digitatum]|uniref:7TM GPCR, rhodopsin-like n=1 Tax=Penicillium digitatum TaxID=36651 RepID=A0A7T7BM75_PENDI|nr:7TM GPCR, rhodopsin-like [Penicillium digitatum]